MKDEKKKEEKKLKTKIDLISVQRDVLQAKEIKKIFGGNNDKCICLEPDPRVKLSTTK